MEADYAASYTDGKRQNRGAGDCPRAMHWFNEALVRKAIIVVTPHIRFEGVVMKSRIKAAFASEMASARSAEASGNMALAKHHLERAHILGQRWYGTHVKTHFHMLRLALEQSDAKEVRGQLVRLIGAAPFHLAGWVPVGNTGGADVSPTLPMAMPADLRPYLEGHSLRNGLIVRGILIAALVAGYLLFRQ